MRPLVLVYRELILGGHLLALGTASIAAAAAFLFGRQPTLVLLVMAYLFSFGAYMMNRSAEMDEDALRVWLDKEKEILARLKEERKRVLEAMDRLSKRRVALRQYSPKFPFPPMPVFFDKLG